jgi:hypothetical protein
MGVKGKEVYTKVPNCFPEDEGFPLFIDFGSKYSGPMGSNLYRLLKNAHLRRSPHPSPRQTRGRLVVADAVGTGLKPFSTKDFGSPRKRDFEDSTCICLPARSPALRGEGRGIFDQPEKKSFSTWFLGDLIQRPRFALPIKIKPFLSFSLLSLLKYLQCLFLPFSCVTKVANSRVGGRKSV